MSTAPPPEHSDERPGDGTSSVSDEQWDAFLRGLEESGAGNAPEEPSARARMVARRLREQDEATQARGGRRRRWRKRAAEPEPSLPAGWRTGPAWQEMNGRSSRFGAVRTVTVLALVVAVTVVALRPSLLLDRLPGHHSEPVAAAGSNPSPLPAETVPPSDAPDAVDRAGLPTRAHPFRGSPAEQWAEGAAAIELPKAKAVGGMSEADVALALRRTKEFLVGANLGPAVLRGGQPTAAMALLDPKQPEVLPELRRSLRAPAEEHDPLSLVSRFDPAEVVLAGEVVKVRGHLTFSAGEPGEVRVHADYSFAYPLVRAGGDGEGTDAVVARTIVRRDLTVSLFDPRRWIATKGLLQLRTYPSYFFNNECDVHDGYFHPVFPGAAATGAPATGPARDPYDRSRSLQDEYFDGCGTNTRD